MTAAAGDWVLRPDEVRASAIFTAHSRLVRVRLWARCPDSGWALGFALLRETATQENGRLRLRLIAEGKTPANGRTFRGVRREAEAIVESASARAVEIILPDGTEVVVPVAEPAGTRRVPLAAN